MSRLVEMRVYYMKKKMIIEIWFFDSYLIYKKYGIWLILVLIVND